MKLLIGFASFPSDIEKGFSELDVFLNNPQT